MSGFIYWYHRDWSAASGLHAIARAESTGLTLDEAQIRRSALADRLSLVESKLETISYRTASNVSLHCGFRRVTGNTADNIVVQEFDLYDLPITQCREVVTSLIQLFNQDHQDTVAFIADRTGKTSEINWDDIVLGKPTIVTTRPDVLALPTNMVAQSHPELHGLVSRRLRKLSVYRGNEMPALSSVE